MVVCSGNVKRMKKIYCLFSISVIVLGLNGQSRDPKAMEYYNSGMSMVFRKNYVAAVSDFTDALRRDSGFLQAYENRGVARFYLDDNAGAIKDYDKALTINPLDYNTFGRRGMAKFKTGDFYGAIADFDMAVRGGFSNINYYISRGQSKYRIQDFKGADEDFSKVIRSLSSTRDQKGKAYFWRGMLRIETGQRSSGCPDLKRSVRLHNKNASEILDLFCSGKN